MAVMGKTALLSKPPICVTSTHSILSKSTGFKAKFRGECANSMWVTTDSPRISHPIHQNHTCY